MRNLVEEEIIGISSKSCYGSLNEVPIKSPVNLDGQTLHSVVVGPRWPRVLWCCALIRGVSIYQAVGYGVSGFAGLHYEGFKAQAFLFRVRVQVKLLVPNQNRKQPGSHTPYTCNP